MDDGDLEVVEVECKVRFVTLDGSEMAGRVSASNVQRMMSGELAGSSLLEVIQNDGNLHFVNLSHVVVVEVEWPPSAC